MSRTVDIETRIVSPQSGETIELPRADFVRLLIDPAGTLPSLTIQFPSDPVDGDVVQISSSEMLASVAMTNGTVLSAKPSFAADAFGTWVFGAGKWFRIG